MRMNSINKIHYIIPYCKSALLEKEWQIGLLLITKKLLKLDTCFLSEHKFIKHVAQVWFSCVQWLICKSIEP